MSEQIIAHSQSRLIGVERLVVGQIIAFSFSFQVTIRFTTKINSGSKGVRNGARCLSIAEALSESLSFSYHE